MTPEPIEITTGAAVAVARIEATLAGMQKQMDHQDRNSAQLVKLFEERMVGRLDGLDRRLDTIEAMRREEKISTEHRLSQLEEKHETRAKAIAEEAKQVAEAMAVRLTAVEKFNNRAIGVMVGVGVASGGTVAVIAKALGGL